MPLTIQDDTGGVLVTIEGPSATYQAKTTTTGGSGLNIRNALDVLKAAFGYNPVSDEVIVGFGGNADFRINANHAWLGPCGQHLVIAADTMKSVRLSGGDQTADYVEISQDNAGAAIVRVISTGETGAVGGGAFVRHAGGQSTIGQGWQTGLDATWDLDLIGGTYDLNLNNKNTAGTFKLNAGLSIRFGIGIGEDTPRVAELNAEQLILDVPVDAPAYKVGGVEGVTYSGPVSAMTIVNGLVTSVTP